MENQHEIKLSSSWTKVGIYGSAIFIVLFAPVLYFAMIDQEFHIGMILGPIIFLALAGFVIYQFMYACTAKVVDDRLVLKKLFRPEKSYSFDKIGYPTSFKLKRTKYTTVEMKNDDGTLEKYVIINSNAILSFENKDAEDILISLRHPVLNPVS